MSEQNQSGSEDSEKGHSQSWHEITHFLSSHRTKAAVRMVRRDTAGPGMETLTFCQTNRTRVAVRTVRRDAAGSGMELLTTCHANKTRVAMRTVRRATVDLAWKHKHSLSVKSIGSEWQ